MRAYHQVKARLSLTMGNFVLYLLAMPENYLFTAKTHEKLQQIIFIFYW
jgi:hypothetical protein